MTNKEFIEKWRTMSMYDLSLAMIRGQVDEAFREALDRLEAAQPAEDVLREALKDLRQAALNRGMAGTAVVLRAEAALTSVPAPQTSAETPKELGPTNTSREPICPKCGTLVEWVVPPIPGAKPFFQCQDGDCNWIQDDGFEATHSAERDYTPERNEK